MLQQFLEHFGYIAVFIGTLVEGETVVVLAGFLAHRGYMRLDLVILAAFLGSYIGDQFWYYVGHRHGRTFLARKPRLQKMSGKALALVKRHPDLWVLGFRFVYGLRTIMPITIGLSGYSHLRYAILNGIGALVWAIAIGMAAYFFGAALEAVLGDIEKYELIILGALIFIGLLFWLWRRRKMRRPPV